MPNTCCDLHLHTYYSDGIASPAEILHHAESIGLKTISITDHDNLNAFQEASYTAGRLGIELIAGIELTCHWQACDLPGNTRIMDPDIDILGYFFDPGDADFQAFVRESFEDNRNRVAECCSLLTVAGYPVTVYDVIDENPRYPGTRQLIAALWHKGYAGSWHAAYPLFKACWPEIRPSRVTVQQAIDSIHAAGGVAVLAHPIAIRCGDGWLDEDLVAQLAGYGLDGIEIYHPRMDAQARKHFLALASKLGLLLSGGSDEHGWNGGFTRMGSEIITYEMVNALRDCAR